jgi:Mg2+ and Co2+ transporter CorA
MVAAALTSFLAPPLPLLRYGYIFFWIVCLTISSTILLIFRYKKWL